MASTRLHPLSSVRLFDAGADGYASDRGFYVHDILSQSWPSCRPTWAVGEDSYQYPTTFLLAELGVVLPAFEIVPRDASLDHWSGWTNVIGGGTWETSLAQAAGGKLFIYHIYTTPGATYALTSDFDLPDDPWFCFSLAVETPLRTNASGNTEAAFVDVVFGGGGWAIQFRPQGSPALFKADGGEWVQVAELPSPETRPWRPFGSNDFPAVFDVVVGVVRGALAISFDRGASWATYTEPGGIIVQQGPVVVGGYGQGCFWWWHEVRPLLHENAPSPAFASMLHPIFDDRPSETDPATLLVTAGYHAFVPEGTAVAVEQNETDAGDPGVFSYTATFMTAQATMGGAPFDSWRFPALCAVDAYWTPTLVAPAPGAYAELTVPGGASFGVDGIHVELPQDLAANSATLELSLRPNITFTGEYRWRYVEIDLGFRHEDDSYAMWPVFAGYVQECETRQTPEWNQGHKLTLRLADATWRFKTSEVDEGFPCLDFANGNEALLSVAARAGWSPTRCSFVATTIALSGGTADAPVWHWAGSRAELRLGQGLWEVMARIADYLGVELFIGGDGVLYTRVRNVVLPALHTFDGSQSSDLDDAIESIEYAARSSDLGTAVIVRGEDDSSRGVAVYAIDFSRERVPGNDPFISWRQTRRVDGREYTEIDECARVALLEYAQMHESGFTLGFESHGNPEVDRREQVQITNVAVGTGVAQRFIVMEVGHDWGAVLSNCRSEFVCRRIEDA